MEKRMIYVSTLSGILLMFNGFALAADQERSQERDQTQEKIYGSQLMTKQERAEHRSNLRAAKSAEERKRIRKEHHERMKERAKLRGVTLHDEPPTRGDDMGPRGGGMGQGGGGRGR